MTVFRKQVNEDFEGDSNSFSFREPQFILAVVMICFIMCFVFTISAQRRQGRVVSANDFAGLSGNIR